MNKKIFLFIVSLAILYFLFSQKYIYTFLVSHSGSGGYFGDWEYVIKAIECKSNFQICDFNYGGILLLLPYKDNFNFFYYKIIPILFIILFVFYVIKIIKLKNYKYYLLTFLLIINPASILIFERANIDILFFIILLTLCYSRIYWINFILINFSFLAKYYPITFFINFIIENKNRSNLRSLFIILFSIIICLIFIYFDQNGLKGFLGKPGETHFRVGAGWEYYFSIKAIPRVLKYLFDINYIFLLVIFYSLFIYLSIKFYKYFKKLNIFNNLSLYSIENKFFILGINTLILCFLFFSNYYYREIYLIASLPLLIKLKDEIKSKQINYIFIFIVLRYVFYSFIVILFFKEHIIMSTVKEFL